VFDNRQIGDTRLSSVQYIKFNLTAAQQAAWSKGASIVSDHPGYQESRALTASELAELASDFV